MELILNEGKIFYFSKFNVKIYYIIIFAICSLFRRFFPFLIEVILKFGKLDSPNFNKSCLFDMVSNLSGDLLTGLYKIYLCFTNKDNKNIKRNKLIEKSEENEYDTLDPKQEEIKKYKEEQKDEMKNKFFLIIIIIALVDIIAQLCLLVFSYYDTDGCTLGFSDDCLDRDKKGRKTKINEDDLIFTVAINILFRYFFSRLFLTIYITYHNLVSLIITGISFIPLIIFNVITLSKSTQTKEIIVYIILNIFMTILYAFEDVMNKVALNKLVIRPYELMFYKALFQIPFFILTFIIVVLLDKFSRNEDTKDLIKYLNENKSKMFGRIIYRFSFIISNIFRTLSLIKVIEILSPNDLFILKALEFVVLSFLSMIKDVWYFENSNDFINFIIQLLCCILMFFASCIANEIFIINRLDLAKETNFRKEIVIPDPEKEIINIEKMNENEGSINN